MQERRFYIKMIYFHPLEAANAIIKYSVPMRATRVKTSSKSTPCLCTYHLATSLALYLLMLPYEFPFILNIHFSPTSLAPARRSTIFYVLFFVMEEISWFLLYTKNHVTNGQKHQSISRMCTHRLLFQHFAHLYLLREYPRYAWVVVWNLFKNNYV